LPQFDGPQMIPHIEIGSISMFAYFFFSLYFIVDISHFDCEFHIFSLHDTDNIEKNDIENIFIVARKAKVFKMLLIVSDNCDIYSLIAKELEYIPKIILLWEFKNYIL